MARTPALNMDQVPAESKPTLDAFWPHGEREIDRGAASRPSRGHLRFNRLQRNRRAVSWT
jgi:hypothetical protein